MPDPFQFQDGGRTTGSNFAGMLLHILGQQISTKVAFVLYDRLVEAVGGTLTPEAVLGLGPEKIKGVGTSRSKAAYLTGLAEHVDRGLLEIEHMDQFSDPEAVDALIAVKGIGQWSAEMFLIHQLHRADILPAGDVGIRNAITDAWQLETSPTIKETQTLGARWTPYRSYASALLWRSLTSPALTKIEPRDQPTNVRRQSRHLSDVKPT
jgi:DNA-3-methyladenine glycosylase II